MALLEINGLSHTYGDRVLYRDASLRLFKGDHMGVVGQNGAGKSTLVNILAGLVVPDGGSVTWQPRIRVGYLDQHSTVEKHLTVLDYLHTAFQSLYRMEEEMNRLYGLCTGPEGEENLNRAAELQTALEAADFYGIDSRVSRVILGLGLDAVGVDRPLSRLSGGQRAKAILAKLLLDTPDVLLLDEPTNFLDREHIDWLSGFLVDFPGAFVAVSHDFKFLDRVCTCICDVEAETLRLYHGTYSHYLEQKEHYREDHIRRYQAQQQHIQRTEEFIRRNIAGVNTRMAQGRRKQLARLERIAPPSCQSAHSSFQFRALPLPAQEALLLEGLEVGYGAPLLPGIDLLVRGGEKLAVTGFNGVGKSTLLKTIMGLLPPVSGRVRFADGVKTGYYEQDLVWEDPTRTPLQVLSDAYPLMTQKEARRHLSRCGVGAENANQPVGTLSGGEQAKVKLCRLQFSPCNFLLLDEPTNHLDAGSRDALGAALAAFPGCVVLVSHDRAFHSGWAHRTLHVGGGLAIAQ